MMRERLEERLCMTYDDVYDDDDNKIGESGTVDSDEVSAAYRRIFLFIYLH